VTVESNLYFNYFPKSILLFVFQTIIDKAIEKVFEILSEKV